MKIKATASQVLKGLKEYLPKEIQHKSLVINNIEINNEEDH